MTHLKLLDLKHEIVDLEYLEGDELGLVDSEHEFRIIDNTTFASRFSIKLETAKTNKSNHNIDFSKDGTYLAYTELDKPIIRVIDTRRKKIIHSFSKHTDEIESLQFSPDAKYLASGGVDGKVYLWSMAQGAFISHFASHPDYVAFLRFSPNGSYLISCGFEGAMICTNIHTKAKAKKYKQHKSRVTAITFLSEHVLITGSVEGEIVVLNYLSGEILARFMTPHGEVRGLTCDDKVIYVSGTQSSIAIYSLKTYLAIATHYITAPGIPSHIDFNDKRDRLIVGCLNGKLAYYNLDNSDELNQALNKNAYKEAYDIIADNPLLEFNPAKEIFDDTWETIYEDAFTLLLNHQTQKATLLLSNFLGVPKITNTIQSLLRDFESYEKFTELVSSKKLSAAYSLLESAPVLKDTPLYLKLEKLWLSAFEKAKTVMFTKGDTATTKLILDDFSKVPSKMPLIQTLINEPNVFKDLISGLKDKDFKKLLTIIAKHSYLKETSEYQQAMKLAEKVLEVAKVKIQEKDFATVQTYAELILNVPHLHDQAEILSTYAQAARNFVEAYEKEEYEDAYTLLDQNPFLIELSEAQEIEGRWREMITACEEFAFAGDVKKIKETLGQFFILKSRANRVGALLKMAYLVQIKKYASSPKLSNADIIKALNTYIVLLSYDPEIEIIINKLHKLRQLELELGEKEMESKEDSFWLSHTNGNVPFFIFQPKT